MSTENKNQNEVLPNYEEWDEKEHRREQLHKITQKTRFDIIQSILMHPQNLPSLEELDFMNSDPDLIHSNRSKTTLREHLDTLMEMGVVRRVELPKDQVKRDNPKVFFGLTEEGKALLDEFDLLGMQDTLEYLYENTDKPEMIQRYEQAPRPESNDTK